MPVQINDLITSASNRRVTALTPKFFHKELTGTGGNRGLIHSTYGPANIPTTQMADINHTPIEKLAKHSSGDSSQRYIPLDMLRQRLFSSKMQPYGSIEIPDTDRMFDLGDTKNGHAWLDLTPQAMILRREEGSSTRGSTTQLVTQYRCEVYDISDPNEKIAYLPAMARSGHNMVVMEWSFNPMNSLPEFIHSCVGRTPIMTLLQDWLDDYPTADRIIEQAEAWHGTKIAEIMESFLTEAFSSVDPNNITSADREMIQEIGYQFRYLETYPVSLDAYRKIYHAIRRIIPTSYADQLIKQNLNLLMNSTLDSLDQIKDQLTIAPATPAHVQLPSFLSPQQQTIVNTTEPLVLVQAGAGSGKSTVILNRVDHLTKCGVDPHDIMVLSFTNAAADNIKEKNPDVGSMTIASMLHEIYALNHPTHELSDLETIINSLTIFFPNNQTAQTLKLRLRSVILNEPSSTTALNAFIENHLDEVMTMLDTVQQSSLELEIILCYQQIDQYAEPASVQSKYLIIDEVQDNSIFEFIYFLKYVAKHKESLFLVGDCSQTLYEFRSANPKALNTLEGSGVFATYQLTTNYRSNQEILDFANVALTDIEANQYANIQLHANSLVIPTATSFQEKVTVNYKRYTRITEFAENLPGIMTVEVRSYIDQCLARGEKVAFLAHSRRFVSIMEETLKTMYPSEEVVSLVQPRMKAMTVFSQFIAQYWNDMKQVDPKDASFTVSQEIMKRLPSLTRQSERIAPAVKRAIDDWYLEAAGGINGWIMLYNQSLMTKDQFFENLRQSLLDNEIRRNAIKSSLLQQKNTERKKQNLESNANLMVSTIHGVKGLEFDNVVVIHHQESFMDEADKRMFYVAFTRAMNTEYILSHGTLVKAQIASDYELLVDALTERDQRAIELEEERLSRYDDVVEDALSDDVAQDESSADTDLSNDDQCAGSDDNDLSE